MSIKQYVTLVAMPVAILAGCGGGMREITLPEPRDLGRDLPVYTEAEGDRRQPGEGEDVDQVDTLTLREALSRALMHNPGLRAASFEVRAAQSGEMGAGLRPDPEVEMEVEEFAGAGPLREFDGAEYRIVLSQPLELGGKRSRRIALARMETESVGWDFETARLRLFSEVTSAFYGVLAEQERLAVVTELLDLSAASLGAVEKRVAAGKDPPLELARAEIDHARMEMSHQRARSALDNARARLAARWGEGSARFTRAAGDIERVWPVPPVEVLSARLEDNPEIAAGMVEERRSRAAYELEKALSWPDLAIRGGVKRSGETGENSMILGLSLPIPLFDRNQDGRQKARYGALAAGNRLDEVVSDVRARLAEAHNDLSDSYAEVISMREGVVERASSVYDMVRRSYSEGKADYLMLLDAQRTLFEVRTHYIEVLRSYHEARAEVERLTGRSIVDEDETTRTEETR